jgi:hypothetical protein
MVLTSCHDPSAGHRDGHDHGLHRRRRRVPVRTTSPHGRVAAIRKKTNMTICQDISRARFNETCRIRFTLARLRRCKKMFAYLLSAENKSYSIWAKTRTRYHLQEGGQIRVARFFLTQYIYQNEGKYTKLPQHYQTAIKYSK